MKMVIVCHVAVFARQLAMKYVVHYRMLTITVLQIVMKLLEKVIIVLKYRVINTKTWEDITDYYDWVLRPDGELNYMEYSDFIGYPEAKLVIVSVDLANDIP
jgi:hypothetical protein